jgi:hypothetical protein
MASLLRTTLKVADEVWIATALLHREDPSRTDFSISEIVERASLIGHESPLRPGVYVHVVQHCVANRVPNPGRYRILFESSEGRRRLFRQGDPYHHSRDGSKVTPSPEDLPSEYFDLLAWYDTWSASSAVAAASADPLVASRGSGKHIWADEHADEYVENLRKNWGQAPG